MNLQAALVILAALGVNGLPALAPNELQARAAIQPPGLNKEGCFPWCGPRGPPMETGKAKRQEDARWNNMLRSRRLPHPTQTPATEKRQRITEDLWPSSSPNPAKGRPPATKVNSEMGTAIFPARPTNGSFVPSRRPDGLTQPGQISSCDGWYYIEEGDTCDTITAKFNIKREQFMEWNPDVSKNCDIEPWVNFSCCVRVSGSTRVKRAEPFTLSIPTPTIPAITPPFGKGIQARQLRTLTTTVFDELVPVTLDSEGNFTPPGLKTVTVTIGPDGKPIETPKPIQGRAAQSIIHTALTLPPLFPEPTQNPKVEKQSKKPDEKPEISKRQIKCNKWWTVGTNDTCESIYKETGTSGLALVILNHDQHFDCDNLPVGKQLCIRQETPVRPVSKRSLPDVLKSAIETPMPTSM
ncbi:hypothetical protein GX51_03274 [Blastomyces parvus]|uniref:LysM domain-containing protein n=1 Tax=Blastomyces parvus TaxID=2060905 RepID=A0A2B7X7A7_9EURO|nr:hypothetical protein GX51_03274 [Blastomyces parvus]